MLTNELFINQFEKNLACADFDTGDTGYETYTFDFKRMYRVTIWNLPGKRIWNMEISLSGTSKEHVAVYEIIQTLTVSNVKNVCNILQKVKNAAERNKLVFDFT